MPDRGRRSTSINSSPNSISFCSIAPPFLPRYILYQFRCLGPPAALYRSRSWSDESHALAAIHASLLTVGASRTVKKRPLYVGPIITTDAACPFLLGKNIG